MAASASTFWTRPRIVIWGVTAAVVIAVAGPTYLRAFLPPAGAAYTDFLQEWLSARNFFTGAPLYREIPLSLQEHMKDRQGANGSATRIAFTNPATGAVIAEMKYNAHPPVAVLLAVPFARLDYPEAHLAWNLITYGLFLVAIAVVVRELKIPFAWPALFPAIILLLGNPVLNQVYQGQLNCLLAALITFAWVADRRGHPALAGAAIGLAGAAKLYPLFLLAYFLCTRRWSGLATGVGVFLMVNGIAAGLFGISAFQDYANIVVPAIADQFQTSWANVSFQGFWQRLFKTQPLQEWIGPAFVPVLGRVLAWGLSLGVTAVVACVCLRAADYQERDRAFAITIVTMLLVSPITWPHYYLLLILPLALVWARDTSRLSLWLLGAVLVVLWLPSNSAAQLWFGGQDAATFNELVRSHLTTIEDLALVSVQHYALIGLFLLVLRLQPTAVDSLRQDQAKPADESE